MGEHVLKLSETLRKLHEKWGKKTTKKNPKNFFKILCSSTPKNKNILEQIIKKKKLGIDLNSEIGF